MSASGVLIALRLAFTGVRWRNWTLGLRNMLHGLDVVIKRISAGDFDVLVTGMFRRLSCAIKLHINSPDTG